MRLFYNLILVLLLVHSSARAAERIPHITALQADSICQALDDMSITTEVYDVTGVIIGINHAQLYAPLLVGEMELQGDQSMDVFRLANFDSTSFVKRDDLAYGDTVTIRTRLSKYKGISTAHYGYLLEVHRFVDPVPELIRKDKAKQWSLAMEEERVAEADHLSCLLASFVLFLLALLLGWGIFLRWFAERDSSTGLYNRYGGLKRVDRILKHKSHGYFCVMDLDHFKEFNSANNSELGDQYLFLFSRVVKYHFAKHLCIRLGGDEFAVFAKVDSEDELRRLMEEFFAKVTEIHIMKVDTSEITVSVGAAYYSGSDRDDFDHLYQRADAKLYESKDKTGSTVSV